MRALSKAIRCSPGDLSLWLNIVTLQYDFAKHIFNKEKEALTSSSKSSVFNKLVGDMEAAQQYNAQVGPARCGCMEGRNQSLSGINVRPVPLPGGDCLCQRPERWLRIL